MARASDAVLQTLAGPEIGVASTKAFTAQLAVLACLALAAGRARGTLTAAQERAMTRVAAGRAGPRRGGPGTRQCDIAASPAVSPKRATCCTSAGAAASRSPWKAH